MKNRNLNPAPTKDEAVEWASVDDEALLPSSGVEDGDEVLVTSDGYVRKRVNGEWVVEVAKPRVYADEAARLARTGFTPKDGELFRVSGGLAYTAVDPTDSAQDDPVSSPEATYLTQVRDAATATNAQAPGELAIREAIDAYNDWTEITASGSSIPGPGKYRINTDAVTLPDHTLHIGKQIEFVNVTGSVVGGDLSVVSGSIVVPFRSGLIASGFDIVPQLRYVCIATAAGWETPLASGTAIRLTQADSGLVLSPGFIFIVTTSAAGMILRLPSRARDSIRISLSNSSTHDLTTEQFDTGADASILSNDGNRTASKLIPVSTKGLRHYFQGEALTGNWDATAPVVPVSMLHLSQSAPEFDYSEYVATQGIPPRHLLQITNTSREFGRTIVLDGTRTLQYKRGNFSAGETANETSFSIPPNGVASISYDADSVYATAQTSRDMGYFSTLSALTSINSNALTTGNYADVLNKRYKWQADVIEGVIPDNNPPFGRWVETISDTPAWQPNKVYAEGNEVVTEQFGIVPPVKVIIRRKPDADLVNVGAATLQTSDSAYTAGEEFNWNIIGEVQEDDLPILKDLTLTIGNIGDRWGSLADLQFYDHDNAVINMANFAIIDDSENLLNDGRALGSVPGTALSPIQNVSGGTRTLKVQWTGFEIIRGITRVTYTPRAVNLSGSWVVSLAARYQSGAVETVLTGLGARITAEDHTLSPALDFLTGSDIDNANVDQIDSWEAGDGTTDVKYEIGDRVVVPMPINADWITNDGAIYNVNYIVEATATRPNTVAEFDDAEADSGNWKLIGAFRVSGNDFRTMTGSGTQTIALNDIKSTETKQHTIPSGVTQAYFYSGNPATISVFDDLLDTVTPTVVDSSTGVLSRQFSVTGPARMTFTRIGNSAQFTFAPNNHLEVTPTGETVTVDTWTSNNNELSAEYSGLQFAMGTTSRQIRVKNVTGNKIFIESKAFYRNAVSQNDTLSDLKYTGRAFNIDQEQPITLSDFVHDKGGAEQGDVEFVDAVAYEFDENDRLRRSKILEFTVACGVGDSFAGNVWRLERIQGN